MEEKKSCFQYVKDTKKKANHNNVFNSGQEKAVVSNTSKILKRKQITTGLDEWKQQRWLFPIRQRY